MKKALLFLVIAASASLSAQASIILSDTFSYADGSALTGSGIWTAHSGGGSNPILATNGTIAVRMISGTAEDDHADLAGAPYLSSNGALKLYSSYTIILSNDLPSTIGTYFSHFMGTNTGAATDFGARVFLTRTNTVSFAPVPDGKFRISIGNGAASTNVTFLGQIDQDLDTNV